MTYNSEADALQVARDVADRALIWGEGSPYAFGSFASPEGDPDSMYYWDVYVAQTIRAWSDTMLAIHGYVGEPLLDLIVWVSRS
jgi:hypothetical protein